MTHDFGDPKRILPAAQRIRGKAVAGLFHFTVGDTRIFERRFPDPAPKVACMDSVSGW
jgi:hypothetical protein